MVVTDETKYDYFFSFMDIPRYMNGEEHEAVSRWLSGPEAAHLEQYSFEKRKFEWLTGRICAKQAILDLLHKDTRFRDFRAGELSINAGNTGRPVIASHLPQPLPQELDVSITHSHGKAAALAGYGLCGIDIQHLTTTLFKVKDRYCSDIEAGILDASGKEELAQLGMLWVAKEAVRKCLSGIRLVGFREIKLSGIEEADTFIILNFMSPLTPSSDGSAPQVSAITHVADPFALAVCILDKERFHA